MKKTLMLLIVGSITLSVYSQSSLLNKVIASSGGFSSGAGTRLTWTLGDFIPADLSGSSSGLNTGFQQSWDLPLVIDLRESFPGMKAYPNPVSDFITVRFGDKEEGSLVVEVLSLAGHIVRTFKVGAPTAGRIDQFDMSELNSGLYLLRVRTSDSKYSRSLRIMKK